MSNVPGPEEPLALAGRKIEMIWPVAVGQSGNVTVTFDALSYAGTLTVKKNGTLLGVAVTSGLTGDLCWAMCCYTAGESVRIKALDPAEF